MGEIQGVISELACTHLHCEMTFIPLACECTLSLQLPTVPGSVFGHLMLLAVFNLQEVRPHLRGSGHTVGNAFALWYPFLLCNFFPLSP